MNLKNQLFTTSKSEEEQNRAKILKKVRRIEIFTRRLVNDVFAGEYHSVFKGRGMEFSEVREYQRGDDIRTIDWNVTARMGHPFVKKFVEERELTVMLLVDASSSGDFGTVQQMKGEIAVEICALLAFSAIKNLDRVGLIIFTDQVEKYIPAKKGRKHVLRVIRELLYFQPQKKQTNLASALEYLAKVLNRRATVFLVSDFITSDYEKALAIANRKHDVITISISDPREEKLPRIGLIELEDAETGETIIIDTYDKEVIDQFELISQENKRTFIKKLQRMDVDNISISTKEKEKYADPLVKFFRMRAKRY